jgi:hypothetical protein
MPPMNVEHILETFNRHQVDYLLIGGMNIFLRFRPDTTFDVDLWIEDSPENRLRCHQSLVELKAEWGATDEDWGPISRRPASWLDRQSIFCLNSPAGSIDIFRVVEGLGTWEECRKRAETTTTKAGVSFPALSDLDMLQCQLALPEHEQKLDRIRFLKERLRLP